MWQNNLGVLRQIAVCIAGENHMAGFCFYLDPQYLLVKFRICDGLLAGGVGAVSVEVPITIVDFVTADSGGANSADSLIHRKCTTESILPQHISD